ncbi:hypothetical protein Nepgr_015477 [Nepenthes gracilis]|uniref:Small VCP/p97-interacting protein n=1 Tax=Nepenthes gracilis TaxID=150966 RepID=A0AAD3XRB8_NEPGR|nr:hypothetical protein Nepgr_015477 [Nepenthes gracilis]
MGAACSCFDDGSKEERREQERLASQEARVKAAEAAERRKQEFDQSAAGRAAQVVNRFLSGRWDEFSHFGFSIILMFFCSKCSRSM